MRYSRTKTFAGAAVLALALAACGGGDSGGSEAEVAENAQFPQGTMMADLAQEGSITIGVKTDQPGVGFTEPGADEPTGFDIEMGKYVAGKLGIPEDQITWKETV